MFLEFDDFIKKSEEYSLNESEWIDIFYKKVDVTDEEKNDLFIMSAMAENKDDIKKEQLKKFDWGFGTDSFGKSTFYRYAGNDEEIVFSEGNIYKDFNAKYEYLVAYRTFYGDYRPQLEINPILKWYGNLVETKDGYIDTITNEYKVKIEENRVSVLREYLKDILAAKKMICVIAFDNRRFTNKVDNIQKKYIEKKYENYNYAIAVEKDTFSDYEFFSSIIGKVLIEPYHEPLHEDYSYFKPKKDQYVDFIIGVNQQSGEEIINTCDEGKLANYFGANKRAPLFLTPVFFTNDVLDRYTNNPAQYTIADDHIMFLNIWSIPYTRNSDRVVVWLGDLGRIPYKEQQYWRIFNVKPYGEMDDKFIKRQLMAQWTDSIGEEKYLFSIIEKINKKSKTAFGENLFNELSEGDKQLKSAFIIPSNNSITQFQEFLLQLNKLTVERINTKCITKVVEENKLINPQDGNKFRSRMQFNLFLGELNISNAEECNKIFKLISDCRNKLAGHCASIPQYNKLWKRKEDEPINCIKDSKELLTKVNKCLKILEGELGND